MGVKGTRKYNKIIISLVGISVGVMGVMFLLFGGGNKGDSKDYLSMNSVNDHEKAFIYNNKVYIEDFGVYSDSEDIEVLDNLSSNKIEVDFAKRTVNRNLKSRNLTKGDLIGGLDEKIFLYDSKAEVWIHYIESSKRTKNSVEGFIGKEVEYSVYLEDNLTSNKDIIFDKGFLFMGYEYLGSDIKDYADLDYDKVIIFIKDEGLINVYSGYKAVGAGLVIIHEVKGDGEKLHKAIINQAIILEVR